MIHMYHYHSDGTVTITQDQLNGLITKSLWKDAMEEAGIENWDKFGEAISTYNDWIRLFGLGENDETS